MTKLHFKVPAPILLGISDSGKSMLCRGKYLLSVIFLMQPFKISSSLLTNGE